MSCKKGEEQEEEGLSSFRRLKSKPIAIIRRDPTELNGNNMEEQRELAFMYDRRTWAMYDRITSHRNKHPLPPCYYDNYNQTTTTTANNDDCSNAQLSATFHERSLSLRRIGNNNNNVDNADDDRKNDEEADHNGEIFDFEM